MFGNPLAEEPDYRFRLIHAMPQIKILDRHMVTLQERQKADKIMAEHNKKRERNPPQGPQDNTQKGFSKGEKDLYMEISKINHREEQKAKDEAAKTAAFFAKKSFGRVMPCPTKKMEN